MIMLHAYSCCNIFFFYKDPNDKSPQLLFIEWPESTVKCRYNAVFGVQEIDRVIAVTVL